MAVTATPVRVVEMVVGRVRVGARTVEVVVVGSAGRYPCQPTVGVWVKASVSARIGDRDYGHSRGREGYSCQARVHD